MVLLELKAVRNVTDKDFRQIERYVELYNQENENTLSNAADQTGVRDQFRGG